MTGTWLLAALLSAGNAELEKAANEGAWEVAVGRERTRLVTEGPARGELMKVMLSKPDAFVKPDAARAAAWDVYKAMIEGECKAVARLAGERMGLTNDCVAKMAFSEAEMAAARKCFDARYPGERAAACAQQAATLVGQWRPSPQEFETQDEAALKRTMSSRVVAHQKTAVFEENLTYISTKIVEPVFAGAKKERKRQGDCLRGLRSEACAPSALATDLTDKLLLDVRERQLKVSDPALAWEVFPSVTNQVLSRVVRSRVMERFVAQVSDTPYAVRADDMIQSIATDRKQHRKAEDSRKVFQRVWSAGLLERALRAALNEAPEDERQELGRYLAKNRSDKEIVKAIGVRMNEEFLPQLDAVRRKLAAAEFAEVWPMLAARTWWPDAETADAVVARRDFSVAIAHWRELPNTALPAGENVMEESSALAEKAVAAAFELARCAIAAQTAVVEEVRPGVADEVKRRKASFWSRTPDLEKIVAMLTDAVRKQWAVSKVDVLWPKGDAPENALAQHAELFPSVRKRIELEAKAIFSEIVSPVPDEKPQEPALLYSIIVSRQGDRVTVKLDRDGKTLLEESPKAQMEAFRGAMKNVGEKLGKEILELP